MISRRTPSDPTPAETRWPLLACYAPHPLVWQVSGHGTVFVARRRPDGKEAWAVARLALPDEGVLTLGGRRSAPAGTHREWRSDLRRLDLFPASVEVPEDTAAAFVYGACTVALGTVVGRWPPEFRDIRAASLLDAPPGGPADWRERLVGPGGPTPQRLSKIAKRLRDAPDIPDGQEPLVRTVVRVGLTPGTGVEVARRLRTRKHPPVFADMGMRGAATVLEWVKPFASGVSVPAGKKAGVAYADGPEASSVTVRLLTDSGHQGMGELAITEDRVVLDALTLSRASVLMSVLVDAAGSHVAIESMRWEPFSARTGR